jgi:hypothetical protein
MEEGWQRLTERGSLLKKQTTSKKHQVVVKREQLSKMEAMLNHEEVTICVLDAQAQELMEKAKQMFAAAEGHGEANIKAQENLKNQAIAISHWEQAVVELEQELQEKEEEVDNMLEHGHNELSSCEADLDTHKTTLEADRKKLGDLRREVLAHELTADLKPNHLAFREKEMADREKQQAVTQPQAAWAIDWDFLGQIETALVLLGFRPLHSGEPVQEVTTMLPWLDSIWVKMLKLEEVVCHQLEAKGHILVEKVVEHVLTCFQSGDHIISLDMVMLRPVAGIEEAASSDVQEATKVKVECTIVDPLGGVARSLRTSTT